MEVEIRVKGRTDDESGAGGLWDLAGKLAETAVLEYLSNHGGMDGPVYAQDCGQEQIYNELLSLTK